MFHLAARESATPRAIRSLLGVETVPKRTRARGGGENYREWPSALQEVSVSNPRK